MQTWQFSLEGLEKQFETNSATGLTQREVARRLALYGENKLPQTKKKAVFLLLLEQLVNPMTGLLLVALIITAITADVIDALAIAIIILLNCLIGFIQIYKAERSLEALQQLLTPSAHVIRDNVRQAIPATDLVPGDIVVIESGQLVPADGRLIYALRLETNEALLTGEAYPVYKKTEPLPDKQLSLGDQINMVFMGTTVAQGLGHLIVTQTGSQTEIGRIASSIEEIPDQKTELEKQLNRIGWFLILIFTTISCMLFIISLIRKYTIAQASMLAISLAVAAIPEGLPTIIMIALAAGAYKMSLKQALVRRLTAIETIGTVSVICTDKTGTLTQNRMALETVWIYNRVIKFNGEKNSPLLHESLKIATLCNQADVLTGGDATDMALLHAAQEIGITKKTVNTEYTLLDQIPFDSERKRITALYKSKKDSDLYYICTKGAPDILLERSRYILGTHGIIELTHELKQEVYAALAQFTKHAYRVLGTAYKTEDQKQVFRNTSQFLEQAETDLIFVGLLALDNPLRPEVFDAIKQCKNAQIQVIMITGDYKDTAYAIARQLDILTPESELITGPELAAITQEQLVQKIKNIHVYSRVSPHDKLRIVNAWQQIGHIVAMTGDGINDAPAIKGADIGISMGKTGTDVTKQAADIIILDDNFASIVEAIKLGRGIYDNIIKALFYLISSNGAEILVITIGAISPKPFIPLLPIQLLWLNIITDGLPALAMATDTIDPRIMHYPPRKPNQKIITFATLSKLLYISFMLALACLTAYFFGHQKSPIIGQSMALTILVFLSFIRIYLIRAHYNLYFWSNKLLLLCLVTSTLLQITILYTPIFQHFLHIHPLTLADWAIVSSILAIVMGMEFLLNMIYRIRFNRRTHHG